MTPQPVCPLFVPGDRPDRFASAAASGADMVIIDLEDAVAAERKPQARMDALDWLRASPVAIAVRVNAPDTPWFDRDLEAIASVDAALTVLVPKCGSAEVAADVVRRLPTKVRVEVLIESAQGLRRCAEVAAVPGVERLVLGTLDLAVDLGLRSPRGRQPELASARSDVVLASRVAGIPAPLDGVFVDISNDRGLARHARRARRFGLGGVLCIHPRQVDVVRDCFSPTTSEIDWARSVVAAAEASDGGVVRMGGEMVDAPVVKRAQGILASSVQQEE